HTPLFRSWMCGRSSTPLGCATPARSFPLPAGAWKSGGRAGRHRLEGRRDAAPGCGARIGRLHETCTKGGPPLTEAGGQIAPIWQPLAAVAGPDHVRPADPARDAVDGVVPRAVVAPPDEETLARVLAYYHEHRL